MTSRWTMWLVGLAAVLTLAAPAWAQGFRDGDRWGHDGGAMFPVMFRGVGLTETQQAQVRQIVANHRARFRQLTGDLRAAREALDARLYGTGSVAAADLGPLLDQVDRLRAQLGREGAQVVLEIRGLLTPDQLARAAQIRQRLKELQTEMDALVGRPAR